VTSWLVLTGSVTGQAPDASLTGRVVDADHPREPIPGALVTLSDVATSVRTTAQTDARGLFTFARVRPGRYMVWASKPPYVTAILGARQPGGAGTTVVLTANQHVDDMRLALVRGAVLTGTVTDMAGMPAPNHLVTAAASETATGVPPARIGGAPDLETHAAIRTAMTDDRGVFRVYGLPPGEYLLAVTATPAGTGGFTYSPLSLLVGLTPPQRSGYGPVFYPGTTSVDDASRVRVAAGDVREGLDIVFEPMAAVTVDGAVFRPDGTPADGAHVFLQAVGPPLPGGTAGAGNTTAATDGRFRFAGVRPGRYVLTASIEQRGEVGPGERIELIVGTADLTGVHVMLQRAVSLSGRVVLEGTSETLPLVRVALQRIVSSRAGSSGGLVAFTDRPSGTGGLPSPLPAAGKRDGRFSIDGIWPGRFQLTASVPTSPGRWWLKSAVAGNRDLLDAPLEFAAPLHDIKDAELTLTDRRTELTGRLQTAAGQPATEYFVVVFSANRTHWFPGARRTRAVRPSSDGTFSVTDLPAGAYLLAALTDAATNEWQRPGFLDELAPLALPVTVPEGGTVRQDLQIAR
jgi:hypothetical protein